MVCHKAADTPSHPPWLLLGTIGTMGHKSVALLWVISGKPRNVCALCGHCMHMCYPLLLLGGVIKLTSSSTGKGSLRGFHLLSRYLITCLHLALLPCVLH